MTAVLPEQDLNVRDVVRSMHNDLDLPEGYRAEIIGGQIAVSASPLTRHAFIVDVVREALSDALPDGYRAYEVITIEVPDGDRYIPDLAVWPKKLVYGNNGQWVLPAQECLLVLEVTSPRHESRDYSKAQGYARGGVPIYLLVDLTLRQCILHTDPTPSGYSKTTPFAFPKEVPFTVPGGNETHVDTATF